MGEINGISVIQVRTSVKEALEKEKNGLSMNGKNVSYSEMIERMLVVWRQYQKEFPKVGAGEKNV